MTHYTPHQRKIIERYYDHRDEILLNRLQEIVSELYLAETEAKRKRLWGRARKAMEGLKVPPDQIEHILSKRTPELLAENLRRWLDSAKKQDKRR